MFQKSILIIGTFATLGAALLTSSARAEGFGLFAGVGVALGFDAPSTRIDSLPAGARVRWVGVPGWQSARTVRVPGWPGTRVAVSDLGQVGPDRHVVCAREDRFDRRERYRGSRPVCWVEAR